MSTEDLTKPASGDSARRAAEEIVRWYEDETSQLPLVEEVAAIIARHAAAPADNDAERYAQVAEKLYGPHDRRFKTAIEVANAIRCTTIKGDR